MQETQLRSLDWEDPLEKETTTHSNILAWEIPWTEEPGGATVHRVAIEPNTIKSLNGNNDISESLLYLKA